MLLASDTIPRRVTAIRMSSNSHSARFTMPATPAISEASQYRVINRPNTSLLTSSRSRRVTMLSK